jgi:hypothetical protein
MLVAQPCAWLIYVSEYEVDCAFVVLHCAHTVVDSCGSLPQAGACVCQSVHVLPSSA